MNQYAEGLNGLLNLLVEAQDSETIRQATEELKHNYFENKLCIEGLAVICQRSPRHEVRQLAAVELRKQINRWWEEIDNMTRITIRGQFLVSVVTEQHDLVRNSLARVISSIARVDLQELGWPELSNFLNQTCTHETPGIREIGLYILYTLFETAGEQFLNQIPSLFDMFKVSIVDTASLKVRVTTVMLLGKLAEFIDSGEQDYIKQFKSMVPAMVGVLEECLKNGDEEKAGEIFEVFDTLLMLDVPLLSDHLVDLIRFFLQVAANREIDDSIRVMALSFLMWAAVYKQSKIRSLKLVGYIIEGVMPVGTEPEPEDNDEEPPSRLAFKVINSLGNNMPPQQVYPIVLPIVTRYLQHQDPGYRKAAMMGLAVIVEGCADYMAPRMDEVLQFVCTGLRDPDVTVRRGACMALSSLADELPAEIKERHKQLIPLVVNLMGDAGAEITSSACNALDAILDGLGKDVVPYLPELCPGLLRLLLAGPTVEMHSSALSAIGSIAHAAGRDFQPYFEQVIPEVFKLMKCTGEPQYLTVRGVATDTAAFIAEAVGPDYFRNYLDPAMQLTIAQLAPEFPRLKESSYGFFAVMARVFGEEFARFLPLVIPVLIQTCEEKERNDDILEGQLDLAGDIEDEDVFENFYFDSVVASEKNFAVQALGDLFENTKTHFLPYVDDTLRQLENLHSHIDEEVRSSVTRSLFTYLRAFHIISHQGEWVPGLPVKYPVHDNVQKMVDFVMVSVMKAWPEEDNKMVVIMILQEMAKALKLVGPALVAQYVEDIARNLLEIYEKRSMCQQSFDDEDYVDEDEEGSAESVLIGAACDLVSALCETLGDNFSSYFDVFMPLISSYYKKSRSPADRSMAVGCLAECINGVKSAVTPHTEKLLQLFIKGTSDDDQTVRSNAAYGLGLLVTFSQIDLSSQYPAILTALHPLFQNQPLPNTTDNAAGAVARLILAHPNAVPLDQVLPVFFTALPLKADYAENEPVFACLFQLFQSNNAFVMNSVPQFLRVFAHVLSDEAQLSNVTRGQLIELIRALNAQSNNHAIASSELARFL